MSQKTLERMKQAKSAASRLSKKGTRSKRKNALELKALGDYWFSAGDEVFNIIFSKTDHPISDAVLEFARNKRSQANGKALPWYKKVVKLDPNCVDAWSKLGWVYYILESYTDMLNASRKCVLLQSKNHQNWYQLATALHRVGKINEAIDAYNKTIRIEPKNDQALAALGRTYVEMGQLKNAQAIYNKLKPLYLPAARDLKQRIKEHSNVQPHG